MTGRAAPTRARGLYHGPTGKIYQFSCPHAGAGPVKQRNNRGLLAGAEQAAPVCVVRCVWNVGAIPHAPHARRGGGWGNLA